MNITLIGTGNMGSALAKQLTRAGHTVRITARDLAKAQALAAANPGAVAAAPAEALAGSDVVVVATGYVDAVPALRSLRSLGSLAGKVVIDITNPLTADYMGLTLGYDTSAAEEIAKAVPEAEVVKAFNTLFAQVLTDGPQFADGQVAPAFFAGDSERAKQTAKALIESLGYTPVDAGPLKNARYLEPLAALNIYLGYGAGLGTSIAPTWISNA
ncbi:NADPH-dependent F420 reductase [Rhodanobacter ginsenosidimutans]|uniref:NADPH-dependent F420 reductase n=1 Tax=Rhodanobacter ginsenosidimutans TaxID=490571 RepID=A0ABW0JU83_9GAMM